MGRLQVGFFDPGRHSFPYWLGDFKLNGPGVFWPHYHDMWSYSIAVADVANVDFYPGTSTRSIVEFQVKESQLSNRTVSQIWHGMGLLDPE